MGIRGLKSWITTAFPGAMQKLTSQDGVQGETVNQAGAGDKVEGQAGCALVGGSYDHVLFDMNAIVHAACGKSSTEEQAMAEIILQLDSVLLLFPATTSVYIALDGVGPTAKIMEQRRRRIQKARKDARDAEALVPGSAESQRRLKFYQHRNEKRKERGFQPLPPQKEGKRMVVDSLQITPGTMFMLRLKSMLNWYSASRMCGVGGVFSFHKPCILISAADVSGEGEAKLLQHVHDVLRALPSPHAAPPSFLLVSPDNDALLLALVSGAMRCDVLVMERGGLAKSQLFTVKSICDTVVRQLGAPPPCDPRHHHAVAMGGKYQLDFLAVCFLSGNDYLPRLRGSTLPRLWSTLIRLLGAGGEHRGEHLLLPSVGRVEINMPLLIKLAGSSCVNHGDDDDDDDDHEDDTPHHEADVERYLRALAWCAYMYLSGNCPDYSVTYTAAPPTAAQLAAFAAEKERVSGRPFRVVYEAPLHTETAANVPLSPDVFCLCLLPAAAATYLPRPLQALMQDPSHPLADIFRANETWPRDLVQRIVGTVSAIPLSEYSVDEQSCIMQGQISVVIPALQGRPVNPLPPWLHDCPLHSAPDSIFGEIEEKDAGKVAVAHVRPHARASSLARWSWCDPSFADQLSTRKQPDARAKAVHVQAFRAKAVHVQAVSQSLQEAPHAHAFNLPHASSSSRCVVAFVSFSRSDHDSLLQSQRWSLCWPASTCPCSCAVGGGMACTAAFLFSHSRPFFPKHFSC
jgi:hypothetical protein